MKKIISSVVALVLSITALTGCSGVEKNYLNAWSEAMTLSETMTRSEGTVSIEVGKEALKEIVDTEGLGVGVIPFDFDKVSMTYDITTDGKSDEFVADLKVTVDNKSLPLKFAVAENKLSISRITLGNIAELIETFNTTEDATYSEMFKYLQSMVGTSEWLSLELPEGYEQDIKGVFGDDYSIKQFSEAVVKLLVNGFEGYETKLITSKGTGFEISLTTENVEDFVLGLIKFIADNRAQVLNAADEFVKGLPMAWTNARGMKDMDCGHIDMSCNGIDEPTDCIEVDPNFQISPFEEFGWVGNTSVSDILPEVEKLNAIYSELQNTFNNETYKMMKNLIEGSHYTVKFSMPSSGSFASEMEFVLNYAGNALLTVKANGTLSAVDSVIGITGTEYIVAADEVDGLDGKFFNDTYPVKKVEMSWTGADNNYAQVSFVRFDEESENRYTFDKDFQYMPLVLADGRSYVPMRKLAEGMGYEVKWEDNKAFVLDTTTNEWVDMSGMLVNDLTYIKVRDFEKLGLTVDYTERYTCVNDDCTNEYINPAHIECIATISK